MAEFDFSIYCLRDIARTINHSLNRNEWIRPSSHSPSSPRCLSPPHFLPLVVTTATSLSPQPHLSPQLHIQQQPGDKITRKTENISNSNYSNSKHSEKICFSTKPLDVQKKDFQFFGENFALLGRNVFGNFVT